MGRFYFHLRTGERVIADDEGDDLADVSAARSEALLVARDLLANAIKAGKDQVPEAVVIADERGEQIAVVPLSTVLPRALKQRSGK